MFLKLVAALALCLPAHAQDGGQLRESIYGSGDYQTELPEIGGRNSGGQTRGERADRGDRKERDVDGGGTGEARRSRSPFRGSFDFGLILWITLALAVVLFAITMLARARGYHRDVESSESDKTDAEAAHRVVFTRLPLDTAKRLAKDGDYAGAIHALLQLTLESFRTDRKIKLEPSLTSRDILRRVDLDDTKRTALESLVSAVERTLFARREADHEDFLRCEREYEKLLPDEATG